HDANPKLSQAFIAALDEASKFIANDKRAAVRIYQAATKVKSSEAELLRILDDPDTHYTITPEGVMKFADFMHRVGTIRSKPQSWKELFFPAIHGLPGN